MAYNMCAVDLDQWTDWLGGSGGGPEAEDIFK